MRGGGVRTTCESLSVEHYILLLAKLRFTGGGGGGVRTTCESLSVEHYILLLAKLRFTGGGGG